MAAIDKAEKVQKIKQVVVMGLLFGTLVWLAIRTTGPGLNNAFVIWSLQSGLRKFTSESTAVQGPSFEPWQIGGSMACMLFHTSARCI
jgi:hypothetical protein